MNSRASMNPAAMVEFLAYLSKMAPSEVFCRVHREGQPTLDMTGSELAATIKRALSLPNWIDYEAISHTLTIHGKRYAAEIFGKKGLNGPVGKPIVIAENSSDVVVLQNMEVAAWRPAISTCAFVGGHPSQDDIEYWREQGIEIEYAYVKPR